MRAGTPIERQRRFRAKVAGCIVGCCLPLLATLLTTAAPANGNGAAAGAVLGRSPQHATASADGGSSLGTVTIEGARERRRLYRHVSRYVASVMVGYTFDSLPRWDQPICPLVAGLSRQQGEYILARITRVATAAHAPLAGEHCRPNLYVVATAAPDLLLRKWWARDRLMFNLCNGMGGVRKFIGSKRPIRVWYNTMPISSSNDATPPVDLDAPALGLSLGPTHCITTNTGALALGQVIVVVDTRQTLTLDIGQLADYVSLVGLAQVQPGTVPAGPSILGLFAGNKDPPRGLSAWDHALLYALYHTPQSDPLLQVARIRNSMVSQILQSPRAR